VRAVTWFVLSEFNKLMGFTKPYLVGGIGPALVRPNNATQKGAFTGILVGSMGEQSLQR
jgi:hypothetical protein